MEHVAMIKFRCTFHRRRGREKKGAISVCLDVHVIISQIYFPLFVLQPAKGRITHQRFAFFDYSSKVTFIFGRSSSTNEPANICGPNTRRYFTSCIYQLIARAFFHQLPSSKIVSHDDDDVTQKAEKWEQVYLHYTASFLLGGQKWARILKGKSYFFMGGKIAPGM